MTGSHGTRRHRLVHRLAHCPVHTLSIAAPAPEAPPKASVGARELQDSVRLGSRLGFAALYIPLLRACFCKTRVNEAAKSKYDYGPSCHGPTVSPPAHSTSPPPPPRVKGDGAGGEGACRSQATCPSSLLEQRSSDHPARKSPTLTASPSVTAIAVEPSRLPAKRSSNDIPPPYSSAQLSTASAAVEPPRSPPRIPSTPPKAAGSRLRISPTFLQGSKAEQTPLLESGAGDQMEQTAALGDDDENMPPHGHCSTGRRCANKRGERSVGECSAGKYSGGKGSAGKHSGTRRSSNVLDALQSAIMNPVEHVSMRKAASTPQGDVPSPRKVQSTGGRVQRIVQARNEASYTRPKPREAKSYEPRGGPVYELVSQEELRKWRDRDSQPPPPPPALLPLPSLVPPPPAAAPASPAAQASPPVSIPSTTPLSMPSSTPPPPPTSPPRVDVYNRADGTISYASQHSPMQHSRLPPDSRRGTLSIALVDETCDKTPTNQSGAHGSRNCSRRSSIGDRVSGVI